MIHSERHCEVEDCAKCGSFYATGPAVSPFVQPIIEHVEPLDRHSDLIARQRPAHRKPRPREIWLDVDGESV